MMQTFQDRFRKYERIRGQSMSGFGLRDYRSSSRRIWSHQIQLDDEGYGLEQLAPDDEMK